MKKLLPLIILILSNAATAQEKQVWACQTTASTGLVGNRTDWQIQSGQPKPLLLGIDGANSSYTISGFEFPIPCTNSTNSSLNFATCNSDGITIVLNLENGLASMSSILGVVIPSTNAPMALELITYQCTKFC